MTKILFVCLGNICRSPMAEFLFKDIIKKAGVEDKFIVKSSATSYEEIGGSVHRGTAKILNGLGIDCKGKYAEKLKSQDYDNYDLFIGMDERNIRNMLNIFGVDPEFKVRKILDFVNGGDIGDPYYYGNFDLVYQDILLGCTEIFNKWQKGKLI
ncbi:MAG: low molecular weight phosphotyrosine protein phosphatase [Clostridia bacterium]|nr:low molecular weight phosphotyrosine protein phosphatase [Clostridia bacterium]